MIIGIDASRANKTQRTGTEWYSYFVIEELKKLRGDIMCQFILYSREPLRGDLAKLPPNFESRVLAWPPKFLWTQIRLSWEMLIHPPDVLFVPAHTLPILGRAKRVVTIHDVGFRVYPELYSWIDILYHRFSVWFASRFAAKIICVSEFTKSELIKYYNTDPKKISAIPLGISLPLTPGRGASEASDSEKSQLFYIGRLEKKKNILGMLKALKIAQRMFSNFRLVLAGSPGHGFGEIKNYIAANRLDDSVTIKGYITEEEKSRLYRDSLAFVFPTFYEGFGLPILEAQAYGCPVITSKLGATAEVAGNSALLVDPNNPEDTAQAILALRDADFRRGVIEKGVANCKKYSWENTAVETLEILENP